VLVFGLLGTAVLLVQAETRRRNLNHRITSLEFVVSTKKLRTTMRSIFDSAEEISASFAYQSGLLDQAGLRELVFSAAVTGVDVKRIRAGLKQHLYISDERDLHKDGEQALADAESRLAEIDAALKTSAGHAIRISHKLQPVKFAVPADTPIDAATAQQAEPKCDAAIEQLQQAIARSTIFTDEQLHHAMETVAGVAAGFDAVDTITGRVLNGPSLPEPADEQPPIDDTTRLTRPPKRAERLREAADRSRRAYRKASVAGGQITRIARDMKRQRKDE
jgi:hypothetical protein